MMGWGLTLRSKKKIKKSQKGLWVGPGPSCTMCWTLTRDRRRREASYSGMTSGSSEPWNNWNWSISRFPVWFFISLSYSFSLDPPPTVLFLFIYFFLASSCYVLSIVSSLITPGMFSQKLNFWQVLALLTLTYCSPLAVFAVASYILANVQYVGVKWTQEAMNAGVGNTRPNPVGIWC